MRNPMFFALAATATFAAQSAYAQTAAAPAAAPARLAAKAGLWEIKLDESGGAMGRTVTTRVCIAGNEAADAARLLPRQLVAGGRCENRDVSVRGAEAAWKATCSGDATRAGSGKIAMADGSFSGSGELESRVKGKTDKLRQTYAGKWIGPCK